MDYIVKYLYLLNLSKSDKWADKIKWYANLSLKDHRSLALGLDSGRFIAGEKESSIKNLAYYLINKEKVQSKAKARWEKYREKLKADEKW